MNTLPNRSQALRALAALPVATALARPTSARAADDLDALLAALQPKNGVISGDRVRASGVERVTLMNRLRP